MSQYKYPYTHDILGDVASGSQTPQSLQDMIELVSEWCSEVPDAQTASDTELVYSLEEALSLLQDKQGGQS